MIGRLWVWVRLSRPHFLLGGFLMFGLGAATGGPVDGSDYLFGQLMVTMAQLTAHYANEYADVDADRAVEHRTPFSGGSGVLVEGSLPVRSALWAARLTSVLTVLAAIVVADASILAAVLGLLALTVSWAYSMPPVRLLNLGWGELATSLVVTLLVPVIGALVQTDTVPATLWWSAAVLVPVHMAMMLVFEIPDLQSDSAAGKRVLAVRIGRRATVVMIGSLLAVAFAGLATAIIADGLPSGCAAGFVGLVAAPVLVGALVRDRHQVMTICAVGMFVLVSGGLLIGLL